MTEAVQNITKSDNIEKSRILAKIHEELLDMICKLEDLEHSCSGDKEEIVSDLNTALDLIRIWVVLELNGREKAVKDAIDSSTR